METTLPFQDEVPVWRHNVTDEALDKFQTHYGDKSITHDDIFDYVVAMLDCPTYLERYKSSLRKATNIPYASDFWSFVKAGHKMSHLHLNYEDLPKYQLEETWVNGGQKNNPDHWKFGKPNNRISEKVEMWFVDGGLETPPKILAVNDFLYLNGIPPEAHEYTIAGRTCLWWIKNRYIVKIDSESGIVNDANDLFDKPQDFIELVKSIVTFAIAMNRVRKAMPTEITGNPIKGTPVLVEDSIRELQELIDEIVAESHTSDS